MTEVCNRIISYINILYKGKSGFLTSYYVDVDKHEKNYCPGYGEIKYKALFEIIKYVDLCRG